MWNEGYRSDINYTTQYFTELSPERIRLSLLAAGVEHSVPRNPDYLELGFGQGLSLVVHAATNAGRFFGNDFNPAQAAHAMQLAATTGRSVGVMEDSFDELARRTDLPQFDVIALHGIWSWINDAGRAAIVDIARRMLRPGGALYISYNVVTGWAPMMPMRTLMAEFEKRAGQGDLGQRITQSLDFVGKLRDAESRYFSQNPRAGQHLDGIRKHGQQYLAHEYYNAEWHPTDFAAVSDALAEAKLTFATSATILETLPGIGAPAAATEILASITDPVLRELTRDTFLNQMFRRDLFVKGPRALSQLEFTRRTDAMRFMLTGDAEKRPTSVKTPIGDAELRPDIYGPIMDAIVRAQNCTVQLGQLLASGELGKLTHAQVWQSLLMLTSAGYIAPVSQSTNPSADETASRALNKHLMDRAEADDCVNILAAPRLGIGVSVNRIEQMLMRAIKGGEKQPVDAVFRSLEQAGQRIIVDGTQTETDAETRDGLTAMYDAFRTRRVDTLKRVGIW